MNWLTSKLAVSCGILPQSICDAANSDDGSAIFEILKIVLQTLTGAVFVLATIGIIISAIQYSSANSNPEQVAKAKKRIWEIAIALIVYAFITVIVNFLIPGGLF